MHASLASHSAKDTPHNPLDVIEELNARLKAYAEREHVLMHEIVQLQRENKRLSDTVDAFSLDLGLCK